MVPARFRFRQFELDTTAHELRRDGVPVDLPVSAFDCLAYLVRHRDRPVSRDELILAVWNRPDVSETLLGQTVARLRRELGDTGSEQHSIRTISRKGYRWVAPVDLVEAPAVAVAESPVAPPVAVPPRERRPRLHESVALAIIAAAAIAALAWQWRRPAAPAASRAALVLPTVVHAPADWDWLRLGLMDLVANRLRRGGESTVGSESVVGLVANLGAGAPNRPSLDDPRLDAAARLRVQPTATLAAGEWRVRLDALDHGRALRVDAQASDVLLAGRRATDLLLAKLGRTPPPAAVDDAPLNIADVVQRAKAAALDGRLDAARSIIAQAPADVRASPEIAWSAALIDANAGQYEAARERLEAELPRVSAERDPTLRARMLTLLGAMHMRRTDVDAARRAYDEALAVAGTAEPAVLAHAYAGRAVVEATERDYDRALADFGRARALGESGGNVLGSAQIDMNVGGIMQIRGQPAAAATVLEDAARRLQALSSQEEWAVALQGVASAQIGLLDFPAALKTAESFSPPRATIANERLRWSLALTLARALADNGRLDEARAQARAVADAVRAPADALFRASAAATFAYLARLDGDAAESARQARLALGDELLRADVLAYVEAWQWRLAGLQQSGEIDAARRETATFVAWLGGFPVARAPALADFAQAEQTRAEGRGGEAVPMYARAFANVEQGGVPDDTVAIGTRYAGLLIERGELPRAVAVAGRLAPWAARDRRAAALQDDLRRALARNTGERGEKP